MIRCKVGGAHCINCVFTEEAVLRSSWTTSAVHVGARGIEGQAAADNSRIPSRLHQNAISVAGPSRERRDFYPDRKRCFLKNRNVWSILKGDEN